MSDVDMMLVCISLGRFFTYLKNLWLEKRKIELSQFQFHTQVKPTIWVWFLIK